MTDVLNINREQEALRSFDRLNERRLNGKFDFTIIAGDQKIYADQNILAAGSDYFDAMLSHDTKERQNGKVEMKGVDFESVKICIDHIYRREISIPAEKYQDMMVATNMLQLQALSDAIEEKMSGNLTTSSFFPIQNVATIFVKQKLLDKCRQFAAENFESISNEDKFNTLEKSFIIELLKSEANQVDEERKLEIILEWVRFDEKRNSHLLALLKCIDFSQISHDVGLSYIKNEPLINANNECLVFFSVVIIESVAPPSGKSKKVEPTSKNQVVIFGQTSGKFSLFNPIEESFKELSWQKLGIVPYSVVNLDGHIYVLGSNQSVSRIKYDDAGATWEQMANMNKPHGWYPPAAVLEGCIYVIGGHRMCSTNAVERYNPQDNRWELLQEAPKAIQFAGILASGNCIYSLGGKVSQQYVKDVTRLDVKMSQWEKLSPMSEVKGHVAAAECGDFIYVAGGFVVPSVRFKTFERYNPSTDQWTVLPQMTIARSSFNLHVVDKHIYAVGGFNSSPCSIEKYDIENETWTMLKKDVPFKIVGSVLM